MEANIQSVIDAPKMRWIFVGGKGGVGKTTSSSSIAVQLAQRYPQNKFLLISTDPAHNLSDAFGQQFGNEPLAIKDQQNLFALEINPQKMMEQPFNQAPQQQQQAFGALFDQISSFMKDGTLGMDEIMNFTQIIKLADTDDYRTIIFDTAPTGHTMRFLDLPKTAEKMFGIMKTMKESLGPILSMVSGMFQMNSDEIGGMFSKLEEQLVVIKSVQKQFQDPDLTQFVCVCIPEFLSLYETERLVQYLARVGIDSSCIIVNQVLDVPINCDCKLCRARFNMQSKYIKQMQDLYDDFHLVLSPLLEHEVRGVKDLVGFGNTLYFGQKFQWQE